MRRIMILFVFALLTINLYSQFPAPQQELRKEMAHQKAQMFAKLHKVQDEQTENQKQFDVRYYDLNLIINMDEKSLYGTVKIQADVIEGAIDHVELNMWNGLNVEVIIDLNSADTLIFEKKDELLFINLPSTKSAGDQFSLQITYNGQPQNSPYGSFAITQYNAKPHVWTVSEPYGARAWWPCKDVPADKADSVDIRVTLPTELILASNGTLREVTASGTNTTYWWHEQYPIVTYLVSLAAYPYKVTYDDYLYNDKKDTMKIHFYSFPDIYPQVQSINLKVKNMIAYLSEIYGEYPFIKEKYGHADATIGGAMEHQTCTTFGFWQEWVYLHELSHQWWGDLVTCRDFHHIWMNEGFAVYSEALWYEHAYTDVTASEYQRIENTYYGGGTIYCDNLIPSRIFDYGLTYQKASWVLHMLRHIVGDDNFFKILKTYYSSPKHFHGTVTTEEFQEICESVSGIKLTKFFQQWIYREYYPTYSCSWKGEKSDTGYSIQLDISQKDKNNLFWMPIDVHVTTLAGKQKFVVWDSLQTQTFTLNVSSEPLGIELDKDGWILKKIEQKISNPTFSKGILLVNGCTFRYQEDYLRDAFEKKAFWGNSKITFWDYFDPPQDGYPSTLPQPIGHGMIPADLLGQFSTIIWLGNNLSGDLEMWTETPIEDYLRAGGNVLLLTHHGRDFITARLRWYLGLKWVEKEFNTINTCMAHYDGLTDMSIVRTQNNIAVFDTSLTKSESKLLFIEPNTFSKPRGIGVWCKPDTGGSFRKNGGQFIMINGKPYFYNPDELRQNIVFILETFFSESVTKINSDKTKEIAEFKLYPNYPNPFNSNTIIRFDLPQSERVLIDIFDVRGRKVQSLLNTRREAGAHKVTWPGTLQNNQLAPTGVYFCRIAAGQYKKTIKIILIR